MADGIVELIWIRGISTDLVGTVSGCCSEIVGRDKMNTEALIKTISILVVTVAICVAVIVIQSISIMGV